ncbi:hypothetical protein U5801_03215 [Lamprobacter modestohalophilus]|uniref:hypothetical protein n=1 Tax=Lamprobacter modestohalophilus TaxID=1064514 RepID=UPI002ADEBBBA|nr:hypothetical protein [Lamprobacter modestohalophilus]MEA1048830.1 hypothetical protein [Lamprobacter modestohalophilus]
MEAARALAEQRDDILEWFNERATMPEFEGGLSRAEAKCEAMRLVRADRRHEC